MPVIRQLTKSIDFRQNYVCDCLRTLADLTQRCNEIWENRGQDAGAMEMSSLLCTALPL
jgi:hypothetical protein